MNKLTEKEYCLQRAIISDDWSEYEKRYPTSTIEYALSFIVGIPTLILCLIRGW